MQFTIVEGKIGRGKRVTFSADNAEEARELAVKRFPRVREMSLYQLLSPGQKPEFLGEEFNMVWNWEIGTGWSRTIPGKRLPLSDAPDGATDKELLDKYLSTLS